MTSMLSSLKYPRAIATALTAWFTAPANRVQAFLEEHHGGPGSHQDHAHGELRRELAAARDPVYAEADLTVESGEGSHGRTVEAIIAALKAHAGATT